MAEEPSSVDDLPREHQNSVDRYRSHHRTMGRGRKRKRNSPPSITPAMGDTLVHLRKSPVTNLDTMLTTDGHLLDEALPSNFIGTTLNPERSPEREWTEVSSKHATKKRKVPNRGSPNYPSITHSSHSRLQSTIKIGDLQGLVLYILAGGAGPQWVSVRHYAAIRRVVVLMVPGIEKKMFDRTEPEERRAIVTGQDPGTPSPSGPSDGQAAASEPVMSQEDQQQQQQQQTSDGYLPVELSPHALPEPLKPLGAIFPHLWPVLTPGDDKNSIMHSPIQSMLISPLPRPKGEQAMASRAPREAQTWQDKPTTVLELVATVDELRDNDYAIHPIHLDTPAENRAEQDRRLRLKDPNRHEWIHSRVQAPLAVGTPADGPDDAARPMTAGCDVLAVDCEMCKASDGELALTRISVVRWDGTVILDELVKPNLAIVDYLTIYSGITKELLDPVQTRLGDIQARLLDLLTPKVILVGHSLNADLAVIGITHPFIVDTSIIYPHPRGAPLKSGLKWLTQKYLGRAIQQGHGISGHSSVEDAKACLDLVKQKCQKGLMWGTTEASSESIFNRLRRASRPAKYSDTATRAGTRLGAVVDWGRPEKGIGATAAVCIGCQDDDDVVRGVDGALSGPATDSPVPPGGVDFVWARLRDLEFARGWSEPPGPPPEPGRREEPPSPRLSAAQEGATDDDDDGHEPSVPVDPERLSKTLAATVGRIVAIYDRLPPCTAFIVYSGSGDRRAMTALRERHQRFRREFKTKKWDELSVQWTDTDQQRLRQATKEARQGLGLVVVK